MIFRKIALLLTLVFICSSLIGQYDCPTTINYGSNPEGQFVELNDIKLYYETYGDSTNQALILIHGNGGSIWGSRCQIEYFKENFYVIAVDSRFHGNSSFGNEILTYNLMAKDFELFIECLNLKSVYILGHSDGGIIGLMLAMNIPSKVKKLVSIAPNLKPDSSAIHQWDIDRVSNLLQETENEIAKGNRTIGNIQNRARFNLMDKFPNVEMEELLKIECPVLVIAADADLIKLDHIQEIYESISHAELFIMPGATHLMIRHEHELLNQISNRFLSSAFKRKATGRN